MSLLRYALDFPVIVGRVEVEVANAADIEVVDEARKSYLEVVGRPWDLDTTF